MGIIIGVILAFVGIAISLLTLLHDFGRIRISLEMPQAAPSRLPPELHALAAVLNAAGWVWLRGWIVGGVVFVVHSAVVFGLAPIVVRRLAFWFRKRDG
jgi:hypothetical protein